MKIPLRCRLGLHSYQRSERDADGRFWCRRCGTPGTDPHHDPDRLPPATNLGL